MSDINTAELTRAELEDVARDLDIKVQGNMKDSTLRTKIDEALGNPAQDEPDVDAEPPAPDESKTARRFEIIVSSDARDRQPVQVGVNGRMYVIKRGEKVIVPESVVRNLETAVREIYDPATMERHEVQSYPFQIVREV